MGRKRSKASRRSWVASAALRCLACCAMGAVVALNLGFTRRATRDDVVTSSAPPSAQGLGAWPAMDEHSLEEVADAVQRLRGRVASIRDRATANAAWARIAEVNDWVQRQTERRPAERRQAERRPAPSVPRPTAAAVPVVREEPPRLDSSTMVVVVCHERHDALRACFESLVRARPCGARVLVSQDGLGRFDAKVEAAVRDFRAGLRDACGSESVEFARHEEQTSAGTGYHKLARHFKFALGRAFARDDVRRAIVIEEDLVVAADVFDFFGAVASIVDGDATLLAASAWNDNGLADRVRDPTRVVRSDFFPGLGWMLTRRVWTELGPKWPPAYWDDWLREPAQRRGRHILRPEVCRTFHQLSKQGGTSKNQYGAFLGKIRLHSGAPVDFRSRVADLRRDLEMNAYDARFRDDLRAATRLDSPADLDTVRPGTTAVRLEYTTLDDRGDPAAFPRLARTLGVMDNIKAGVPRAAYRGVVDFWRNQVHVYLAPPLAKVEAQLFTVASS